MTSCRACAGSDSESSVSSKAITFWEDSNFSSTAVLSSCGNSRAESTLAKIESAMKSCFSDASQEGPQKSRVDVDLQLFSMVMVLVTGTADRES